MGQCKPSGFFIMKSQECVIGFLSRVTDYTATWGFFLVTCLTFLCVLETILHRKVSDENILKLVYTE